MKCTTVNWYITVIRHYSIPYYLTGTSHAYPKDERNTAKSESKEVVEKTTATENFAKERRAEVEKSKIRYHSTRIDEPS